MDLPLTSPAIPALVHPRRARQLHILQFRFLQSVSLAHRDAAFGFVASLTPAPLSSLFGFPFSFRFFFLRRFFSPPLLSSFLLRTSSLSLLGFPPPVLFRSPDHGCPPPPVRARVSGLRLFLVYRFPFFVKVSDTLIRCVVLFPFLHRDCCFARSRCNYLYLSSFDNVL